MLPSHKDSKGNIEYSEEYTYDSQNNNILINKYDSTKKLTGYNKFVFKNQLCVSSSSKDENGSREVIHSYNENRIAKTYSATSYDNFGKITKKEINTYEYYPNSKLIHTQIEKSQDYIENKTSERVITLDTLGRMIKDNHQNGNVEELLYSGKNKGCDKIYWYTDGILITTTSYKYDDNENIISRNDKWSADNSTSNEYFEYEYDLNRNWTKRIHTTSYGIKKITLRTIIYY